MTSPFTTAFSIIVPTYQEAKNIGELVRQIAAVDFGTNQFEVIIVDDNSQDGTEEIVKDLQSRYPFLRLLARRGKKSLSLSVIDGFKHAVHPVLISMDADLSHPPTKIPEMLNALLNDDTDLVLGSRYIAGGESDGAWPIHRKMISRFAAFITRMLTAIPVSDPLSGFFTVRKSTFLSGDPLDPVGWRMALEIMIKCHCKKIREVPIHFSQRYKGHSKLNFKIILKDMAQIHKLAWYKIFRVLKA